jgi:WD40 repeat protein
MIFISYRRQDTKAIAGRIFDRLAAKFRRDAVFMDIDSIPFGVDFHDFLNEQVGRAQTVLALIGPGWVDTRDEAGNRRLENPDDFVRIEIEAALKRGIPLGAVLIDGAPMPRPEQLPETMRALCRRNAIAVDSGRDFHLHMERLIADLQRHLGGNLAAQLQIATPAALENTAYENSEQRLVRTFSGHSEAINSVAFDPSLSRLALSGSGGFFLFRSSKDNTIKLWDIDDGRELGTISGHMSGVNSVAFSPDGHLILSGSRDNTLRLWERGTYKQVQKFEGHTNSIVSVVFSPDGHSAISGSADNTVKIWDTRTGRCLRTFSGHSSSVTCVAVSPDGKIVISGGRDKVVRVWELDSGREKLVFAAHPYLVRLASGDDHVIRALAIAPNGQFALSSRGENELPLWNIHTGQEIGCFSVFYARSVAFSPDGRFALSNQNSSVLLLDVSTKSKLFEFRGHLGSVNAVAFSPDNRFALSGSDDKTLKLWDISEWTQPQPADSCSPLPLPPP